MNKVISIIIMLLINIFTTNTASAKSCCSRAEVNKKSMLPGFKTWFDANCKPPNGKMCKSATVTPAHKPKSKPTKRRRRRTTKPTPTTPQPIATSLVSNRLSAHEVSKRLVELAENKQDNEKNEIEKDKVIASMKKLLDEQKKSLAVMKIKLDQLKTPEDKEKDKVVTTWEVILWMFLMFVVYFLFRDIAVPMLTDRFESVKNLATQFNTHEEALIEMQKNLIEMQNNVDADQNQKIANLQSSINTLHTNLANHTHAGAPNTPPTNSPQT